MRRILAALFIGVMLCSFLTSCSKNNEKLLIGTWKNETTDEVIEFTSDGKVKYSDGDSGTESATFYVNYDFGKPLLCLNENGDEEPFVSEFSIKDDDLKLYSNGRLLSYHKQ